MGEQHLPIAIEAVAPLDAVTEVGLLIAAHEREPNNPRVLNRLVDLLLELDRFDAVIALLEPKIAALDFGRCMALTKACLFTRASDPIKAALALRATDAALALADTDELRACALAERGKALDELGRDGESTLDLRRAFRLDPRGTMAMKRFAMLLLRERAFAELEAITAGLIADGLVRTDILAARVLALAGLGEVATARELAGFDRFALSEKIEAPLGWTDLAAFNSALAAEIRANRGMRFERFATASQHSWRVDEPARGATPAIDALLETIVARASRWIAALPLDGHLWLAARPSALQLKSWCVITEAEGFERWHLHPEGWISGGYYAEVPTAVTGGSGAAGCFAFGLPERDVGTEAAAQFGEKLVRPYPGMLSLFPSHAQHSTKPHGAEGQRICLAFDLCPT